MKETEDKIDEIKEFIEKQGIEEQVQVSTTENGIAIRILETIMFDLGKAELKSTAYPVLNKIAELIRSWPNRVRIEGHTDDLPIKTAEFRSNWDLSADRALNVIYYFKNVVGIDVKKMVCQGHGENNPVVPNDSDQNRVKNRRVEIFMSPVIMKVIK